MRLLSKFVSGVAALAAMLLMAVPAHAVVTETSVTQNGVTCLRRDGGTYPENGHYFYCGSDATKKSAMKTLIIDQVLATYTNVRNRLSTANADIFVFANSVDAFTYKNLTPPLTTQQMHDDYVGAPGISDNPGLTDLRTIIFEDIAVNPGTFDTVPASMDQMKYTAIHELGHRFDYGSGTAKSDGVVFHRFVEHDQVQFDAKEPDAPTLRDAHKHIIVRNAVGVVPWRETYADQFVGFVLNAHSTWATMPAIYDEVLSPYFTCSAMFVEKNVVNNRDPNASETQIAGCHGTIVCREYNPTNIIPSYPVPDSARPYNYDAWVCGQIDTTHPTDPLTNTPSLTRQQELFDIPADPDNSLTKELNKSANDDVLSKLVEQRVKYYFFRNRDDANDFFDKQRPFNANSGYQSTEPCGHTFYNSSGFVIAVAIFDQCKIGGVDVTNPSLLRTAIHETGHAFALAYARGGDDRPDATPGFSSYFTSDKNGLTPTGWSGWNATDKTNYICGMFGSVGNSNLEKQKGSHSTQTGPVCTGGVVNSTWTGHDPKTIAVNDLKVPADFFGGSSYIETWAEEFTVTLLGKNSPSDFLPITDSVIGYTAPNGTTPPRAMNCTRLVVETYRDQGRKPTGTEVSAAGCPAHTEYP